MMYILDASMLTRTARQNSFSFSGIRDESPRRKRQAREGWPELLRRACVL